MYSTSNFYLIIDWSCYIVCYVCIIYGVVYNIYHGQKNQLIQNVYGTQTQFGNDLCTLIFHSLLNVYLSTDLRNLYTKYKWWSFTFWFCVTSFSCSHYIYINVYECMLYNVYITNNTIKIIINHSFWVNIFDYFYYGSYSYCCVVLPLCILIFNLSKCRWLKVVLCDNRLNWCCCAHTHDDRSEISIDLATSLWQKNWLQLFIWWFLFGAP